MTKFKCDNCGKLIKSSKGSVFKMEQIVKWNKQCKKCNTADMFEYNKRTINKKESIDQFGESTNLFNGAVSAGIVGLVDVLNTSNDITQLFN